MTNFRLVGMAPQTRTERASNSPNPKPLRTLLTHPKALWGKGFPLHTLTPEQTPETPFKRVLRGLSDFGCGLNEGEKNHFPSTLPNPKMTAKSALVSIRFSATELRFMDLALAAIYDPDFTQGWGRAKRLRILLEHKSVIPSDRMERIEEEYRKAKIPNWKSKK